MSERYKVRNPEGIYFVTLTITDWIDLFIRPVYKQIIVDSLIYCQKNKGLVIHAYVLMSNHFHAILSINGEILLQEIIRDFKKHTSKLFIRAIKDHPESRREWLLNRFERTAGMIKRGVNYKVWQDGFHPVELTNNKMIEQRLEYIHNNPVKEEIVINPEYYNYSSAADYSGRKGMLDIVKIE